MPVPAGAALPQLGVVDRARADAILNHLDEDPGLKPRQAELFAKAYRGARADAAAKTNLPLSRFSALCPYTLDR